MAAGEGRRAARAPGTSPAGGQRLGQWPEGVLDGRDIEAAVVAEAVRDCSVDVVAEMQVVVATWPRERPRPPSRAGCAWAGLTPPLSPPVTVACPRTGPEHGRHEVTKNVVARPAGGPADPASTRRRSGEAPGPVLEWHRGCPGARPRTSCSEVPAGGCAASPSRGWKSGSRTSATRQETVATTSLISTVAVMSAQTRISPGESSVACEQGQTPSPASCPADDPQRGRGGVPMSSVERRGRGGPRRGRRCGAWRAGRRRGVGPGR